MNKQIVNLLCNNTRKTYGIILSQKKIKTSLIFIKKGFFVVEAEIIIRILCIKVTNLVILYNINSREIITGGIIMRTGMALLIKFILTFVAAFIAFDLLLNNDISWILLLSLVAMLVNYLIGDLMVLPARGNIAASIGDGLLAAITAYIFALLIPAFTTSWSTLLWFAILIGIAEYFFHLYLKKDEKVAP